MEIKSNNTRAPIINSQIVGWYEKKTKLSKKTDIKKIYKYLHETNEDIGSEINFSYDYIFRYFDLDKIDCTKLKLRPENICKLNFHLVIKNLRKYFPNNIITIKYEVPGDNDKKIKNINSTLKYDIYIQVYDDDDNFYDIGIEYNESIHNRHKDHNKYVISKVNLDRFYVYDEKDSDYNTFMHQTVESLFTFICASNNDKYCFSKIIYFKNYYNEKSLEKDTSLVNTILSYNQANSFNFKNFFEKAGPLNLETEEYFEFDEFIEYLFDMYKIKIDFIDEKFNCKYKYFTDIIMRIDSNCSTYIYNFRMVYVKTMETLQEASDLILNAEKSSRNSKKMIPEFIDNFLLYDIQNYSNKDRLEHVKTILNKKK